MKRYHKKVYMPIGSQERLQDFTDRINSLKWLYTPHSIDNIKYRALDLKKVLSFIRDIKLQGKDIFEYYEFDNKIIKVCYRVTYNSEIDIILVVGYNKDMITVYYNSKEDRHITLKKELYVKDKKVS